MMNEELRLQIIENLRESIKIGHETDRTIKIMFATYLRSLKLAELIFQAVTGESLYGILLEELEKE